MKKYYLILTLMIFVAALSRLLPHPLNFTPLTALSLFGVCYLRKSWQAFLIPFAALLLSDIFLGFYSYMWAVYGAFFIISICGYTFVRKYSLTGKLFFLIPASFFFFIVTNSAVFFQTDLYPQNWTGYVACLAAGIPFLKNSLAGDLSYGMILFGSAELLKLSFFEKLALQESQL